MGKHRLALCLAVLLLFSACGAPTASQSETVPRMTEATSQVSKTAKASEIPSATGEIFAMDTYMTITCYGTQCQAALDAALAEIQRLDDLLSVGNGDSEISIINTQSSGTLSSETMEMVEAAIELSTQTQGAFDITVAPLMELWGFTSGNFSVPETTELQALLDCVGSEKLTLDESTATLTLGAGQGIDLGGIAKGYTSGRLMEIFAEYDLVSGLVSLGGNVQCYGTKPDGSLWRCGIQDPLNPEDTANLLGILSVADRAVITSGAYERYFVEEETGETYHHILDPRNGYPANAGLISVTVVSENGMLADGLSTACYVMGLEESIHYWEKYGSDFDLILMTEDGEIYVTEPLEASFTSDYPTHIIAKEA
jgi:thiamine biosynthesis lipoprotein